MGKIPMRCKVCGNTDINKMVVEYLELATSERAVLGATTLSKFIYELKYPERKKIRGAGYGLPITASISPKERLTAIRVVKIWCDECLTTRHKGVEIKPTRWGI